MDPDRLSELALPAGVPAHVSAWLLHVDIDHFVLDGLDAAEQARCLRYRQLADRARFAQTRRALRTLLGTRLGVGAHELELTTGAHGKPKLAREELAFNVSHAGSYALLAMSAEAQVGIDLERTDERRPVADLATQFFSPQESAQCAGDAVRFHQLWSCKEAVVKAWGSGIGDVLPLIDFDANGPGFAVIPVGRTRADTHGWRIGAPQGYVAALALA